MATVCVHAGWVLLVSLLLFSCSTAGARNQAGGALPRLNINPAKITTSGVSAGGAFAIQFHVTFSATIKGAGIFAGPPYWCANDNVDTALSACMSTPSLISVSELVSATNYAASLFSIDDPKNLADARVWIFTGEKDTVVHPDVVRKTDKYYGTWMPESDARFVGSYPAEHAWITDSFGNACSHLGSPYINNCGIDAAGSMLQQLYQGTLANRSTSVGGKLISFSQQNYTPLFVDPSTLSMGDTGYVFVPAPCMNNSTLCDLHVVFHGCNQDLQTIGDDFIKHSGLNEWADANNIVLLFPQVRKSAVLPYNPKGCFDWWGYTGADYATSLGPQVATVANMVSALAGAFGLHNTTAARSLDGPKVRAALRAFAATRTN